MKSINDIIQLEINFYKDLNKQELKELREEQLRRGISIKPHKNKYEKQQKETINMIINRLIQKQL